MSDIQLDHNISWEFLGSNEQADVLSSIISYLSRNNPKQHLYLGLKSGTKNIRSFLLVDKQQVNMANDLVTFVHKYVN